MHLPCFEHQVQFTELVALGVGPCSGLQAIANGRFYINSVMKGGGGRSYGPSSQCLLIQAAEMLGREMVVILSSPYSMQCNGEAM